MSDSLVWFMVGAVVGNAIGIGICWAYRRHELKLERLWKMAIQGLISRDVQ
jgi:hypothetical protein